MSKKFLHDIDVSNKKVLVRLDLNVPTYSDGSIADDTRIVATLPTLKYLLNQNCSLVLMSHFKRPGGKYDPNCSLKVCASLLSKYLNLDVQFAPNCVGKEVDMLKNSLKPKEVLLLENIRFHKEEDENDACYAKELANGCDLYVNDAFGCCHRTAASTVAVTSFFPDRAVGGLLLQKEIEQFDSLLKNTEKNLTVIIGGAKISTKIGVLRSLLLKIDKL